MTTATDPTGPTLPTEEEWAEATEAYLDAESIGFTDDRGPIVAGAWDAAEQFVTERTRGATLIGPQSAEDVDRLAEAMYMGYWSDEPSGRWATETDHVRKTWRAHAAGALAHLGIPTEQAPTQPDEPTGLGAVVEDGRQRWTRAEDQGWRVAPKRTPEPWTNGIAWRSWAALVEPGPVTVLHEGWSQ